MPAPARTHASEPLERAAAEWDALADRVGAGPFVRPGWFSAFADAFGGPPITALTLRAPGGALEAVVALRRGRGALASPTNWHTPHFGAVAVDDRAAEELARAVLAQRAARLDLSFLDPAEPFARAVLAGARDLGRGLIARPVLRSPYVRLEGDFAAYEATRPSKFRREIGRRRKKLAADHGEVVVTFTDGADGGLDALLTEGFAVEGSGWKTERGTAIAQDPATERFYRAVAHWAAARGWLQLGFVRVAGRAVAFSYAIVLGDTVHVVKVGFDPAFSRYAVGTLLTRESIARAYEQGRTVYDFLGAEDRYKLDWTEDVRERIRVQAFSRTAQGLGELLVWRHGRPAAKRAAAWARERRDKARA